MASSSGPVVRIDTVQLGRSSSGQGTVQCNSADHREVSKTGSQVGPCPMSEHDDPTTGSVRPRSVRASCSASAEFVDEAIVHIVLPGRAVARTRCEVIARHRVHDRVVHRVRDLPTAGPSGRAAVAKRVLVCAEGCGAFRQRAHAVPPRVRLTVRVRAEAVRLVSGENRSVASVRRDLRGVLGHLDTGWDVSLTPRPEMAGSHHRQTPRPARPRPGSGPTLIERDRFSPSLAPPGFAPASRIRARSVDQSIHARPRVSTSGSLEYSALAL
jgi:hypothetical protein